MRALHQFESFDLDRFLAGKRLAITAITDLFDRSSGAPIGKKVECAIVEDHTAYSPNKDGNIITNLYEKVLIKVKYPHSVEASIGDEIIPVNATATVYGDYRNKLSITADGFKIVSQKKG